MVYQEKTPQQIGLVILITCLVDNVLKSQGESACLSLLSVELHKDIFSPLKLHLSKRGIRNVFTQTRQ